MRSLLHVSLLHVSLLHLAEAIVLFPDSGRDVRCRPTTSVRLDGASLLRSYVGDSPKSVGGDDFYVSVVGDGGFDVAVAHVADVGDGTYRLKFSRIEEPAYHGDSREPGMHAVLLFSCGDGRLDPPHKQAWNGSGALNVNLLVESCASPRREQSTTLSCAAFHEWASTTESPTTRINLDDFDGVIAVGDSTVRMFSPLSASLGPVLGHLRLRYVPMNTLDRCSDAAAAAANKSAGKRHRELVLLGAGTWDLLDGKARSDLAGYKELLASCMRLIRGALPNAQLMLRSLMAVHPQRVACTQAICDRGTFGGYSCGAACRARVKYLSASRAERLYTAQEHVAAAEGVPTLASMYALTSRHAHYTHESDGRHYTAFFNDWLWWRHFSSWQATTRNTSLCATQSQAAPHASGSCSISLIKQDSRAACTHGVSFGCTPGTRSMAWVRNCRGLFRCETGQGVTTFGCGFPAGRKDHNCSCDSTNVCDDANPYNGPRRGSSLDARLKEAEERNTRYEHADRPKPVPVPFYGRPAPAVQRVTRTEQRG